jgi:hypothetical protein
VNIARPPKGFVLRKKPAVTKTLDEMRESCPWLDRAYEDAIARLRMSGHKEGRVSDYDGAIRSIVEVDPATGKKRLGISYTVFADVLTVYGIRVLAVSN